VLPVDELEPVAFERAPAGKLGGNRGASEAGRKRAAFAEIAPIDPAGIAGEGEACRVAGPGGRRKHLK